MNSLEKELEDLKKSLIKKYKENKNNLIYLRLSALDKTTEDPIKDALDKLKGDFNSLIDKYPTLAKEGFLLFIEIKSAYKNSVREVFIDLYENHLFKDISIKDVLENNHRNENKNLYVSSFDRISRVFLYSLTFQMLRKLCNINIYSLSQEEYDLEIKSQNIKDRENQEQLIYVFQLMMFSSMASKHSEDMSYKIKKRVTKNKAGKTISSKSGKNWGAKQTISNNMKKKIIERSKKFTYKEISEQVDIYKLDSDNKKQRVSPNTIRAIVSRAKNS